MQFEKRTCSLYEETSSSSAIYPPFLGSQTQAENQRFGLKNMNPRNPKFTKQSLIQHFTKKSDIIIHKMSRKIAEKLEKKRKNGRNMFCKNILVILM